MYKDHLRISYIKLLLNLQKYNWIPNIINCNYESQICYVILVLCDNNINNHNFCIKKIKKKGTRKKHLANVQIKTNSNIVKYIRFKYHKMQIFKMI